MRNEPKSVSLPRGAAARDAPAALAPGGEYAHILVPTSLASRERPALLLGLQTAASHGAKLTVLHVVPSIESASSLHWLDGIDQLYEGLSRPAGAMTPAERLAAFEASRGEVLEFVERQTPASARTLVDVRAEVRVGEVADEIARYANEEGADLLILTSDLARGWLPLLPGRLRRILQLTWKQAALVRPDASERAVRPAV